MRLWHYVILGLLWGPLALPADGPRMPKTSVGRPLHIDAQAGHAGQNPKATPRAAYWTASSGWVIGKTWPMPTTAPLNALQLSLAANEGEALQLLMRPTTALTGVRAVATPLYGPGRHRLDTRHVDVLTVGSVRIRNTPSPTTHGIQYIAWPDPLLPMSTGVTCPAHENTAFWVRIDTPPNAVPGRYSGHIQITASGGFKNLIPIHVDILNVSLPLRPMLNTILDVDAPALWTAHQAESPKAKADVINRYWDRLSRLRISPADPVPHTPMQITWPSARPLPNPWTGGRVVANEAQAGRGCLAVVDHNPRQVVTATCNTPIPFPPGGIALSFGYRTTLPNHPCLVELQFEDDKGSPRGTPHRIPLTGNGSWQNHTASLSLRPPGVKQCRLRLYATRNYPEQTGMAWFDQLAIRDLATDHNLLENGDFESAASLRGIDADTLNVDVDLEAWDSAIEHALKTWHFGGFRIDIPGLGGGSASGTITPDILGFPASSPHYTTLFSGFCDDVGSRLNARKWWPYAFAFCFDQPTPDQYPAVRATCARLHSAIPRLRRVVTEQIEPALITPQGGPTVWAGAPGLYTPDRARERLDAGEEVWWSLSSKPDFPYAGLHVDHPGTALRALGWQAFTAGVQGLHIGPANRWSRRPLQDPISRDAAAECLIYPPVDGKGAPVLSRRLEALRDGIEDHLMLSILNGLLEQKGDRLSPAVQQRCEALLRVPPDITDNLTRYTTHPAPIETRRQQLMKSIVELMQ